MGHGNEEALEEFSQKAIIFVCNFFVITISTLFECWSYFKNHDWCHLYGSTISFTVKYVNYFKYYISCDAVLIKTTRFVASLSCWGGEVYTFSRTSFLDTSRCYVQFFELFEADSVSHIIYIRSVIANSSISPVLNAHFHYIQPPLK